MRYIAASLNSIVRTEKWGSVGELLRYLRVRPDIESSFDVSRFSRGIDLTRRQHHRAIRILC